MLLNRREWKVLRLSSKQPNYFPGPCHGLKLPAPLLLVSTAYTDHLESDFLLPYFPSDSLPLWLFLAYFVILICKLMFSWGFVGMAWSWAEAPFPYRTDSGLYVPGAHGALVQNHSICLAWHLQAPTSNCMRVNYGYTFLWEVFFHPQPRRK